MNATEIRDTIVALFKEREGFKDIGPDDDYFGLGVSSLTIVTLQIKVEERLGVNISTRELMGFATMNDWIDAYAAKCSQTAEAECASA
jgi:acyl carrier protein